MIAKFARLEFELFTKPSKSDFLLDHQALSEKEKQTSEVPNTLALGLTDFIKIGTKSFFHCQHPGVTLLAYKKPDRRPFS
jgi:hypothetical protein